MSVHFTSTKLQCLFNPGLPRGICISLTNECSSISEGLSVRAAEALVRRLKERKHESERVSKKVDPNTRQLERSLGERLGADVSIQHRSTGKGSLTIRYGSLDELDGILAHIK